MESGQQTNKSHRGASKKSTAKKKLHQNGQNKKAFAVSAPRKLERMARRSHDMNEKKLHVPMVDRTPEDDPPPVIVAVVGPPGTGKTTLIKSLIRRLTKQTLSDINGPITVVSGKRRRLTFIEVGNDLNTMIDIAKIADLVLLLIDGNFGLEMETMEFLNIAQHHGMPRVLGVATHLDLFKSQSTLRTSKKRLKHRFWTEVYQGAKLFYLSGVINGRYPDREILNLSRFISVMKFRPLRWRNEHPYLLADRVTDLTHPEEILSNPKCDRKIALYGYLHGTPLPYTNAHVHIAGMGDYFVKSVEKLPDPCPTPYFEQKMEEYARKQAKAAAEAGEVVAKTTRRRKRLEDKQKIIYAPMSDVGGVLIDNDAVYIDVGDKEHFIKGENMGEGEKLVTDLQEVEKTAQEKFKEGLGLQLFSSSKALENADLWNSQSESDDDISEDLVDSSNNDTGRKTMRKPRLVDNVSHRILSSGDENSEDIDEKELQGRGDSLDDYFSDEEALATSDTERTNYQKSASKLRGSFQRKWDINKLLYLDSLPPSEVLHRWLNNLAESKNAEDNFDEEEEEDFFKKKTVSETSKDVDYFIPEFPTLEELRVKFSINENKDEESDKNGYKILKSKLLTFPKLNEEEEAADNESDSEAEEDLYGDFEDLEGAEADGDAPESEPSNSQKNESVDDDFYAFDEGMEDSAEESESETEESLTVDENRKLNAAKKAKLKLQFEEEEDREFGATDPEGVTAEDTWYDVQKQKIAKQLEINKLEFDEMDPETRLQVEGFKAGSYVKLTFEGMPCEFIENFQPNFPVVVGGLLSAESRFGIMNVRIRRHRWHKKILKSQDPLVLSLGWRRFQTLPIYTTSDSRTRNRMLKYTPEHAYCFASFYGPLVAPSTTFVGFNVVANKDTTGSFRVAATGVVEDINSTTEIVKKLKLVGYPYKIFRTTAFIKDMFSDALEVAKFEGAAIKTVSGIRGEIKRALALPPGHFRATFEDKILMSDIVFLKTWYPIEVKRFYNPVTSLLLKDHTEWRGMKLTGQVRAEKGIETPSNPDSTYRKIERSERKFNPLKVPKSLKGSLPFKSQIHQMKPQKGDTYMSKRAVVLGGDEKKARDLMQKLATIKKQKEATRKAKKHEKFQERLKALAKKEEIRSEKEKERKKDFFAKEGRKRSHNGDTPARKRRS